MWAGETLKNKNNPPQGKGFSLPLQRHGSGDDLLIYKKLTGIKEGFKR